jgi:hypothetical protein
VRAQGAITLFLERARTADIRLQIKLRRVCGNVNDTSRAVGNSQMADKTRASVPDVGTGTSRFPRRVRCPPSGYHLALFQSQRVKRFAEPVEVERSRIIDG